MHKLVSILAAGLVATTALTGVTAGQDFTSIKSLPVITDDCGQTSCADRRNFTIEQIKAILADATAAEKAAAKAQAATEGFGNAIERLQERLKRLEPQVVYLNFEQSSPTFQAITFTPGVPDTFVSHVYTQAERDAIQANIESRYEGFNVILTQTKPTSGEFSTLNFECQDADGICIDFGAGILFGLAQSIDIRNEIRDDSAFVDGAGLWEALVQIDPTGGFFSAISGVPVVDGDVQAALSFAIINQASNTGAHELGHNLGLRHHDSFGAPGTGVTPGTGDFFPVFDGPLAAVESFDHTMASGASVGTSLTDSTLDLRFFSERSAIKLATIKFPRLIAEEDVKDSRVRLRRVFSENPLESGENADDILDLREARIVGRIDESDEVDSYRFKGKAGEFVSAEFFGFDTPSAEQLEAGDFVIGALSLFYVESDGSLTLVRQNFQNFEGFDALIVDAPLEKTGEYVLQVSSPDALLVPGFGVISLDGTGNGVLRTGNYEVSLYMASGLTGRALFGSARLDEVTARVEEAQSSAQDRIAAIQSRFGN